MMIDWFSFFIGVIIAIILNWIIFFIIFYFLKQKGGYDEYK